MKTKKFLSIAIMAALPFAAHATDPVGPAAVPAGGTAVIATASAPYASQTPTAADATHIASTAYVKGAYNDAIAAVNKIGYDAFVIDDIVRQFINDKDEIPSDTIGSIRREAQMAGVDIEKAFVTMPTFLDTESYTRNLIAERQNKLINPASGNVMSDNVMPSGTLSSGIGGELVEGNNADIAAMTSDLAGQLSNGDTSNPDDILISTGATFEIVREVGRYLDGKINTVNNKRVEIYTTWENDNAKQQVAFVTASGQ